MNLASAFGIEVVPEDLTVSLRTEAELLKIDGSFCGKQRLDAAGTAARKCHPLLQIGLGPLPPQVPPGIHPPWASGAGSRRSLDHPLWKG